MKYELTGETMERDGATLHRIRALKRLELSCVEPGEIGGWVGSAANLSQEGECWIWPEAAVWEDARVEGDCRIAGRAEVRGRARLAGFVLMDHDARVQDDAVIDSTGLRIGGTTTIFGRAQVRCGEDGPQVIEGLYADFDISHHQPYAVFCDPGYAGLVVAVSSSGRVCVAPTWDNPASAGDIDGLRPLLAQRGGDCDWLADAAAAWLARA